MSKNNHVSDYRDLVVTHLKYIKEKVDANHKHLEKLNGRVRTNEVSISWIKGIGTTIAFLFGTLFNVLCETIEIVKPDIYIDLGDIGEWNAFSAWKYKRKKAPPLEFMIPDMDADVDDVNKCMDQVDESLDKANCTEKYITEGNHDNWS